MSVFEQFKRNRDARPDAAAFLIAAGDRSVPITWRQFARDIEVIAHLITHYAPGATIGLLGENSYEWVTAHAAGLFAGVRVVPLEITLTAEEIAERLAFTEARILVHSALYAEKAQTVGTLVPRLIVAGFGSPEADLFMARAQAELEMGEPGIFDLPPRDPDEVAMIVFTSGTTSKPRGVQLTLRALDTFVAFASARLRLKDTDRSLMLLPLHHIYGLSCTYLMLTQGVALGVCPDFRRFYDAVARFRANVLYLVPALADILVEKIERHAASAEAAFGRSLDWVLSGGAPLARRTYTCLRGLGIAVRQIYGLTETCALYAMTDSEHEKAGSAGLACGGHGGMETKVSPAGHLLVRGPSVFKGYLKEASRTVEVLDADGWFDTGDVGRIDEDGQVWVTGRASRTIILSSGKKIAPEELEDRLRAIPDVREVVVSGDGATRELTAEIFSEASQATLQARIAQLNRTLPVHKRIRRVVRRVEPFPRTSSGKISFSGAPAPASTETANVPVTPPRDAAAFWKAYSIPLAAASIVVVVVNILHFWMRQSDALVESDSLELFETIGEIVLAVLVIMVVLGVRHRFRTARRS